MEPIAITPSLEDYLEVILELSGEREKIRVTDLAEKMRVAKSSVNQAINRLLELKLILHQKYGPLELTASGREKAVKILRRHKILKSFFTDILRVDQANAERDACIIEHHLSGETMDRLVEFLEIRIDLDSI